MKTKAVSVKWFGADGSRQEQTCPSREARAKVISALAEAKLIDPMFRCGHYWNSLTVEYPKPRKW